MNKLINKALSWLHHRSENNFKVVMTILRSEGKVVKATVDYLVDGKLTNIRTFNTVEDATVLYKSLNS